MIKCYVCNGRLAIYTRYWGGERKHFCMYCWRIVKDRYVQMAAKSMNRSANV